MKKAYWAALFFAFAFGFSAYGNAVTVKGMKNCGVWIKSHAEQSAPSMNALADNA
jgi:hypothetical protein